MPPGESIRTLGWKFFFGLLMLFQIVALGVMWRTYDAVANVKAESALTTYKVNDVVLPELREHRGRLDRLTLGK